MNVVGMDSIGSGDSEWRVMELLWDHGPGGQCAELGTLGLESQYDADASAQTGGKGRGYMGVR